MWQFSSTSVKTGGSGPDLPVRLRQKGVSMARVCPVFVTRRWQLDQDGVRLVR